MEQYSIDELMDIMIDAYEIQEVRPSGPISMSLYTWSEVLDFFRPNGEYAEDVERFSKIETVNDLNEFIAWQNDGWYPYEVVEAGQVSAWEMAGLKLYMRDDNTSEVIELATKILREGKA